MLPLKNGGVPTNAASGLTASNMTSKLGYTLQSLYIVPWAELCRFSSTWEKHKVHCIMGMKFRDYILIIILPYTFYSIPKLSGCYRLRSERHNVLGRVRLSVHLFVLAFPGELFDIWPWFLTWGCIIGHYQSKVFVCVSVISACMRIIARMWFIGF